VSDPEMSTNGKPPQERQAIKPSQRARPERFGDAVLIVDPGASNPSGVADAVVKACAEVRAEGGSTGQDPAVRLMVTQLAWLCRGNSDVDDYGELLAECRRRASAVAAEQTSDAPTPPESREGSQASRIAALIVPILVVLGLDQEGKPRAARFAQADEILAKRAVAITGFRMITVDDPVLVPLAVALPEGRVLRGNAIIPEIANDVYAKLAALIPADVPATAAAPSKAGKPAAKDEPEKSRPVKQDASRMWDAVKVGDVVLATHKSVDGWWPAVVIALVHGDRLRIRWRDYEEVPPVTVRRQMIGFLHPSQH
jgi:hypothetical protein